MELGKSREKLILAGASEAAAIRRAQASGRQDAPQSKASAKTGGRRGNHLIRANIILRPAVRGGARVWIAGSPGGDPLPLQGGGGVQVADGDGQRIGGVGRPRRLGQAQQ